jgi:DNA-binding ferritin-like protein (Dps family)
MTIEIIEVLLALVLLVMVIYLNKTYEKRIKQIKSDYYNKGYTDGIDKMTNITLEMFESKKIKSNEYEVL